MKISNALASQSHNRKIKITQIRLFLNINDFMDEHQQDNNR